MGLQTPEIPWSDFERFDNKKCAESLDWSPWILAIAPSKPKPRAKGWAQCAWAGGVRSQNMWGRNTTTSAVYELAVQTPNKKKRHTVYIRPACAFPYKRIWDNIVQPSTIRKEVRDVIRRRGSIFIRRATTVFERDAHTAGGYFLDNFCYAWRIHRNGKRKRRNLKRDGFILSHSNFV